MSDDKFFQFPLCTLAQTLPKFELMAQIIRYGITEAGRSCLQQLDVGKRREECVNHGLKVSMSNSWNLAALLGADACSVEIADPKGVFTSHHELDRFHQAWVTRNGPDPLVRIKTAIVFDVRDGEGTLSLREFRVLCAIYSVIGRATYRAITARMIRVRAIGCKSEGVEGDELGKGGVLPPTLTDKELRGTISKLHQTGWFARVTPARHGRVTYYSNRMTETALAERIIIKRTFTAGHDNARQKITADVSKRIVEKKGDFNRTAQKGDFNSPEKPAPFLRNEGQRDGDDGATEGQREGDDGATEGQREGDYNRKPPNKKPPNIKPSSDSSSPVGEAGYVFEGVFLPTLAANKIFADNPERWPEMSGKFKSARRIGESIEEIAA